MKIELISVCDMWEKLKEYNYMSVWNDDNVFESIGMDEFVDDVNEMEGKEKGFSEWFWSDWDDGENVEFLERNRE